LSPCRSRSFTQSFALYGKRVEQILGYLEETDDLDTFRRRLTDMLADLPEPAAVEKVRDATWYARLMGLDRGRG
jgi:hypothetical protein